VRNLKKWFSLVSISLILALVLVGCGSAATTTAGTTAGTTASTTGAPGSTTAGTTAKASEPMKLALIAPMTGDSAQYGNQFKRGIELYLEEYNKKGAFNGAKIELTVFDDKNDPKEAVNIANRIVADGDYLAVIGPFSSTCGMAMAEVLDEEKILTISPSVSHADYVKNFDYTFRLSHVNSTEGQFVAKYCAQKWDSKKIAAIYTNNDWGLSLDDAFKKEVAAQGMELVANEPFIIGQIVIRALQECGFESANKMIAVHTSDLSKIVNSDFLVKMCLHIIDYLTEAQVTFTLHQLLAFNRSVATAVTGAD
jgi:outer membrane PBP1 activator LpoA protein